MEKIIQKLKSKENIGMLLLIIFSLLGVTLCVSLTDSDELWVFQNIYKMYNGFQIYIDANVICTPLFFYLGNILFHILGANFFVLRIYNILIFTFFYFITYKILRILGIEKKVSTICILLLIMFGDYMFPRIMANYNTLAVVLCLLGIYLMLRKECEINYKTILLQSIICFLIILTKQNIGIFYFIALSIIILLNKKDNKIKAIIEEVIILVLLGSIFIFFLKLNGLLDGFINYAILGINQFATDNINISWLNIFIIISILLVNLGTSIFMIRKGSNIIDDKQRRCLIVLSSFSTLLSLTAFPIVNTAHSYFAIYVAIIEIIYIVNMIFKKSEIRIRKIDKILKIILLILVLVDIIINIYNFCLWYKYVFFESNYKYEEPFFGTIIDNELKENIENVVSFIQEKEEEGEDVIVFSSKAALYMVPLKESNGFYDMPFNGNFGRLTEEEIINDLKIKENTLVLIEKEEETDTNWQENKNIKEKIKNEFDYIGSIENFEIYSFEI